MEKAFWDYWKKRWPHASCDHEKIKGSANYQETRAAFEAGYQAAQQGVHADEANESLCVCGKPIKNHNGVACLPEPPRG